MKLDILELAPGISTRIHWEDTSKIIVEKPKGIPCHATKDPRRIDFTSLVEKKLGIYSLRTVNRLDLDTSGLIILGKSLLGEGSKERNRILDEFLNNCTKLYWFLAHGNPDWEEQRLEHFLKEDKKRVISVRSGGKKAITEIRILCRNPKASFFLGEARIRTGRRHQIRVQMAEAGFPLLGDELYGGRGSGFFLHSRELIATTEEEKKNPPSVESSLPLESHFIRTRNASRPGIQGA